MYNHYGNAIEEIKKECNYALNNNPEMKNSYTYKDRLKRELELLEENGNVLANKILYARHMVTTLRSKKLKTVPMGGLGNLLISYLLGITRYNPIEMDLYLEFFFGLGKKHKDLAAPFVPEVCIAWDYERSKSNIYYRCIVKNMTDVDGNVYKEIEGVRFYDSRTITRLHNLEERSEQYIEQSINKDYIKKEFTYEKYLELIAGNVLNDKDIFLKKIVSIGRIAIIEAYAIIEKITKKEYSKLTRRQLELIERFNVPTEILDQMRDAGKCYAGSEVFGFKELEWIHQRHNSAFKDARTGKLQNSEIGKVLKNYTGTESVVVIPEGITHIGSNAFSDNVYLKKIVFPRSLEEIGKEAFCECVNLEEVVFKEGLKTIEETAFGDCSSLKSVVLPSTIEWIGEYAFSDCRDLKEVIIPKDRKNNTYISCIGDSAFLCCRKLEYVNIEKPVEDWGDGVFARAGLKFFVVPENPTYDYQYLSDRMFEGCKNLELVKLPKSLESIGKNAFWGCTLLEDLIFVW